jgi:hypothetical protein
MNSAPRGRNRRMASTTGASADAPANTWRSRNPHGSRIAQPNRVAGNLNQGTTTQNNPAVPDSDPSFRLLGTMRWQIKSFSTSSGFRSAAALEGFLKAALAALQVDDRQARTKAAETISDEKGLHIIRDIVEMVGKPIPDRPRHFQTLRFESHIAPFLKLLVHKTFTNLALEGTFQHIVKVFYGPDGERAARYFHGACSLLCEERNQDTFNDNVHLLCLILHAVVRHTSDAVAHEGLIAVHEFLRTVPLNSTETTSPIQKRIDKSLDETAAYLFPLSYRLAHPKSPAVGSDGNPNPYRNLEHFIDNPGERSDSGPRHDNDSAKIDEISILPTKNELQSPRPPYLPINHPAAPHFLEGPARLFDIHFRLLREDMLGPLRSAIGFILDKARPGAPLSECLGELGHSRSGMSLVRLFHRVSVDSASFQRRRGLVFRFRFEQPRRLLSLSKSNRINQWKASRSLEDGSLLCLVSNVPSAECFLVVTKKDEDALGSNSDWAYISLNLAEPNQNAQKFLLRLLTAKNLERDSLALIEFPGILLASYKSILENLQTRWKHPYLPFSYLLDHDPPKIPHGGVRAIDPPSYASQDPHFTYDLGPIKSRASPSDLRLSPQASQSDEALISRLELETTLDRGQCKALIAGLTQELALIQGKIFFLGSCANLLQDRRVQEKHISVLRW